jgi:hypothetical protein
MLNYYYNTLISDLSDYVLINNQQALDGYTFTSGENVLFKRGESFYLNNEDLPDNLILGAYGSGEKPIIKSSVDIDNWDDEGDGTWSVAMSEPSWVWFDGVMAKKSETPWIRVTNKNNSNTLSINDSDVSAYSSIVGSQDIIKNRRF